MSLAFCRKTRQRKIIQGQRKIIQGHRKNSWKVIMLNQTTWRMRYEFFFFITSSPRFFSMHSDRKSTIATEGCGYLCLVWIPVTAVKKLYGK